MTVPGMDPVRGLSWCTECGALVLDHDAYRHSAWHRAIDDQLLAALHARKTKTDE